MSAMNLFWSVCIPRQCVVQLSVEVSLCLCGEVCMKLAHRSVLKQPQGRKLFWELFKLAWYNGIKRSLLVILFRFNLRILLSKIIAFILVVGFWDYVLKLDTMKLLQYCWRSIVKIICKLPAITFIISQIQPILWCETEGVIRWSIQRFMWFCYRCSRYRFRLS